jgi:Na+-driven multidrug efflux pump
VIGIGAGASVLIGQAWGAREPHKVKAIAGTALALGLLLGCGGAVRRRLHAGAALHAGHAAGRDADRARLRPHDDVRHAGLLVFILLTQLMRGVGDTVTPLLALAISTAVSCVLTPAFIRGWFGLPQLGVTSAAVAAIASFTAAPWLSSLVHAAPAPPAGAGRELLRALRIEPQLLKLVVRIGLPTGLQMIVISLAEIALLSIVNRYGSNATAAYGAVNQVVNYVQFPALSIAITASILGAQAIGAGQPTGCAPSRAPA